MHCTENEAVSDITGFVNCAACVRLRLHVNGGVPQRAW